MDYMNKYGIAYFNFIKSEVITECTQHMSEKNYYIIKIWYNV
jgi:hypothetical protein